MAADRPSGSGGPLDGILDEGARVQPLNPNQSNGGTQSQSAWDTQKPPPEAVRPQPNPNEEQQQPTEEVRRLYSVPQPQPQSEIDKLNARIRTLEAMILAMRSLVAMTAIGVAYAVYKVRKLEKTLKSTDGDKPVEKHKTIEVEGTISAPKAEKSAEVNQVGD